MYPALETYAEKLEASEIEELETLEAAVATTREAYQAAPTAAKKRDWDAARDGLALTAERLLEKYRNLSEQVFDTVTAAGRWLRDQGYKLGKSKLHADAKKGLLRVAPDGRVRQADTEAYIVRGGLKRADGVDPGVTDALAAQKYTAELDKTKEQTRSIIFDREIKAGKYILKEEAVTQRVDQLTVMETHFRQVLHTRMLQWCYTLAGNPDRVADAIHQADLDLDGMLNALARSESFTIVYEEKS